MTGRHPSRRQALGFGIATALGCLTASNSSAAQWPAEWRHGNLQFHADFHLPSSTPVLADLADLQDAVPRTLHLEVSVEPIHVYLFRAKRTYQGYLKQYFPGVPYRRALFIKQRGPGMVFAYYSDEFAVDLRHEATHAILHTSLPFVPLWLDEGLAEYYEMPPASRIAGHPHLPEVRRQLARRQFPELTLLEDRGELSEMSSADYRDAWAWVHFLLHGPPSVRRGFISYLADIQAHAPPGLLSHRLQLASHRLKPELVEHFARLEPAAR